MKNLLPIALIFFAGCYPSNHYYYSFALDYPTQTNRPKYENDTLSISFDPGINKIGFDIFNKTNEGMKIEWDEVSMSYNGKTYRMIHGNGTLGNITIAQPPSTIPPKSLLTDAIFPVDNISAIRLYSDYFIVLKAIFPNSDNGSKKAGEDILKRKGSRIVIYLPYYLGTKLIPAYYNIDISDVYIDKKQRPYPTDN